MTGDKVYEKLAAMTPEERACLSYAEPWHVAYAKDMLNALIERGGIDTRKAGRLLKNDRRLMELLEEAVGCDNAREYANDEVDDYLRSKLENLLGKPAKQEKEK